jgi:signal transduction histidine kinase
MDEMSILVVDDETPILDVYRQYLAPEVQSIIMRSSRSAAQAPGAAAPRYRLLLASTGEEAVDIVERELAAKRRICAGFFDMKMPGGIDGLETIRRVRALDADILCAVVTAYQEQSIDEINLLFQPDRQDEWDYLNKPFTQGEIQQKARGLVSSWKRRRREEQQRQDLESLIGHLSAIQGFTSTDLTQFLEYVLRQLVEFTGGTGGFVAMADQALTFRAGVGMTDTAEKGAHVLSRHDVAGMVARTVSTSTIETSQDFYVMPFLCVREKRVVVLLQSGALTEDQRRLVRIFAQNASAALENQQLHAELVTLNASLETRVRQRTDELQTVNTDLASRTAELERTLSSLREAETQLVQNEKLAMLGQLAAGVAHEINNPAAYILTNVELLQKLSVDIGNRLALEEKGTGRADIEAWSTTTQFETRLEEMPTLVEEIADGTRRIVGIVRDLRSFSGSDRGPAPIPLQPILDRAVRILENEIRHVGRVRCEFAELPPVMAESGRLLQVFLNLVINAVHALPKNRATGNLIRIVAREVEANVVVEVIDNGSGIPEANLERIFDPFFTTKLAGVGTGLGLSICRTLVAKYNGALTVKSTMGQGSTFTVTLPVFHGQISSPRPAAEAAVEPVKAECRRLKVLLIDDEPAIPNAYRRALQDVHDIHVVTDGRDALTLLDGGTTFDVIVCDLMMPNLSGWELYARIREQNPSQRMIFITGGVFSEEAKAFVAAHATDCLQKPIPAQLLRERIEAVANGV